MGENLQRLNAESGNSGVNLLVYCVLGFCYVGVGFCFCNVLQKWHPAGMKKLLLGTLAKRRSRSKQEGYSFFSFYFLKKYYFKG